jgi:hypothetical protein
MASLPDSADTSDAAARRYMLQGDQSRRAGNLGVALDQYREARASQPKSGEVRIKLAHGLKLTGAYDEAAEVLRELAGDYPNDLAVAKEFGRLCAAQHRLDEALEHFRAVVNRHPADADAHHWLASLEHLKGNTAAAESHFRRTVELDPVLRVPAAKQPPDFSALLLFAPGGANTPPDTLVKSADYDALFLLLMPGIACDVERLRTRAQVVVNLISDVDHDVEVLQSAAALVEQLGLPVINHPRAILHTNRTSIAARLSRIPGCRVPAVTRFTGSVDPADGAPYPFLVRVAGTHGGASLTKIGGPAAFGAYLAAHPGAELYLTEYVDCQSADGFFRKYRFFFIRDEVLPYHLAIHDMWKVHHGATDMARRVWKRDEEGAFLQDPAAALGPRQLATLQAIRGAIGLDFCGIDCTIAADGQLVVFEVNASMLVHEDHGVFAYKTPAIDRIKRAFGAMLAAHARP